MCQVVETSCFIANVISEQPDRDSFSLSELGKARRRVEKDLQDRDVVVEWTRSAFLSTMFYYRDFFSKRDETMTVTPKAQKVLTESFVAQEFNVGLDSMIQDRMRASIRAALGAGG